MNKIAASSIRKDAERFLTETCTISAEVITTDAYGAQVSTWQTFAQDVPCRVITSGISMQGVNDVGQRETMQETYRIAVPASIALSPNQRITVGGRTYHVVMLAVDLTEAVFRTCYATRLL
jgi:head-tail adaptor